MKLIIFDLDNTLIDIGNLVYDIFRETVKQLTGKEVDLAFYKQLTFWRSKSRGEFEEKLDLLGVKSGYDTFFKLFNKIHKELIKSKITDGSIKPMPGALDLLSWLNGQKKLAIATNTPREIANLEIEMLHLNKFFDCIITPQDVKNTKPHANEINLILSKFNIEKDEVLLVGDSNSDIIAGQAAGIKTALLITEEKTAETNPDYTVQNLLELKKCLES